MQEDLFGHDDANEHADAQEVVAAKSVLPKGVVYAGHLQKMRVRLDKPVSYHLDDVLMNDLIGQSIKLTYQQHIRCIGCGADTNKSFSQGFCYRCFTTKASCDACIMSPEKCHFEQNTCREPAWGEQFCNQSHYVYLANSSGVKVGITRGTQVPVRWIDQGATQALPIFRTTTRQLSGLVEVALKQHVTDKTNWRTMLKGVPDSIDLVEAREALLPKIQTELDDLAKRYGLNSVQPLIHATPIDISYPVTQYPEKVNSFNFDKESEVTGVLQGIKGQYLILDTGVINIRRFTGYQAQVEVL